MHNQIKLTKARKEDMINRIKSYFSKERDEDLGDLAAELILDFFIKDLSIEVYNQGLEDAHAYMQDKLEDLFSLQIVKR